jgi:hypothetical protein
MRIHFSTITPNLKEFVRRTALFFTLVAYEIRLAAYSNQLTVTVQYSVVFSINLEKVDCKHNVCIISSEISVFIFGRPSSEHKHNQLRDTNY